MGYGELLEDMLMLKEEFKERVCIDAYGCSLSGKALPLIKIGNGKRKLLAIGSIHGREAVSSAFLMRCVFELLAQGRDDFEKSVTLYLCPMANPDGVEIFMGREKPKCNIGDYTPEFYKNNANNINLNANFPYQFSLVPKSRQGGKAPASELETKALINLCKENCFDEALSVHSRGNCIFWRDCGNGEVKGDYTLAEKLRDDCGFKLISPTKSAKDYSGGFENWFRHSFKKPALCVELIEDEGIGFYDSFKCFDKAVLWEKTKNLLCAFIEG